MRRLLLAAALAAPSVSLANTRFAPVVVPVSVGGAAAGSVAAGILPPGPPASGDLARSLVLFTPAITRVVAAPAVGAGPLKRGSLKLSNGRRVLVAALQDIARLSGTVVGGRQAWDRAPFATGSGDLSGPGAGLAAQDAAGSPKAAGEIALAPATREVAAPYRPAVEEGGRWQRMKASTKHDFRALFASVRTLKDSLILPRSIKAIKANARAAGRFLSEVRQLGWKVIGAVILYYLIRDSILYVLIPYLILNGVFK